MENDELDKLEEEVDDAIESKKNTISESFSMKLNKKIIGAIKILADSVKEMGRLNKPKDKVEVSGEVTVKNMEKHPDEMKVSNFPDKVEIKRPEWIKEMGDESVKSWKKLIKEQFDLVDISKLSFLVDLAKHEDPEHAIFVKGIEIPKFTFPDGLATDKTMSDLAFVIRLFLTKTASISELMKESVDAIENIEIDVGDILIEAEEINLNTDDIENLLTNIEINTDQLEGLLTLILGDTGNLDVLLSTRASEATLDTFKDQNRSDVEDVKDAVLAFDAEYVERTGDVEADPDAQTVLGRLKAIEDKLSIDEITGSQIAINYPHHEVHEGDSFVSDYVNLAISLNQTILLCFKTPPGTKRVHLIVEYSTLIGGDLKILEAPTWTTGTGSQNIIFNRKRESSPSSSAILEDTSGAFLATDNVVLNPTGLAGGTILHHFFAWGKKEKISGGDVRDTQELVLKPGTQYAIVFTSADNSNKAQVIMNWYEHTDLN